MIIFLSKFRYHRNKLKHLLLISKKQYYTNFFINHNNDIKNTWRGIKQIINIKRTSYNTPHKIEIGNSKVNDKQSIVHAFNNFLSSIGPDLAANIPKINSSFEKFMTVHLTNSFVLLPVTTREVEYEIEKLNTFKSIGPVMICGILFS